MRVDNRFKIIPYCCFGSENCTSYIGQKGYFENDIDSFKYMDLCKYGTLEKIYCDQAESFQMKELRKDYKFFIPEVFVVPKEKKYRPFTLKEFQRNFEIGKPIKFRRKYNSTSETYLIYLGYTFSEIEHEYFENVFIGNNSYYLNELFEKYEYEIDDVWKPFGVKE